MMAMAGIVLAIARTNLANLLLARSTRRQREIATRIALGASRSRLIRQLLTESLALSLIGASVGLFVGHWGTKMLIAAISFPHAQTFLDMSWDPRMRVFLAGTILSCALVFGLIPAIRAINLPVYSAMKGLPRSRKSGRRFPCAALIVTQVSLSMVLIVSAGLLVRTLQTPAKSHLIRPLAVG
jgi:ABC-type antimicrobial peptide transport system permease subunit